MNVEMDNIAKLISIRKTKSRASKSIFDKNKICGNTKIGFIFTNHNIIGGKTNAPFVGPCKLSILRKKSLKCIISKLK